MKLQTLAEAERYLEGFLNLERAHAFDYERLGLARIRALLEALGHPEVGLPCVHIAGSTGKGTVALALESLLLAAGQRVGTYTSPHLETWRERFRVGGEPVSESQLDSTLRELLPAAERLRRDPDLRPSFFDVSTALALLLFRELGVDAGVIEVGLGGRLDSTNVIHPRVSVLTSVQLEHTDKLGSTLEKIAFEKAGIMRARVPLVYGPLSSEALAVVMARAVAEDTPLYEVSSEVVEESERGLRLRLADGREIFAPVLGRHQATNLALAVSAAEQFLGRDVEADVLKRLGWLKLPARVERFGDLILDCAHTPDSARALRDTLQAIWPDRRWVLVVSISSDKDAARLLAELAPRTRAAVITLAEPLRSAPPETLAPLARAVGIETVETCDDPSRALARARAWLRPGEALVVTGSVYLAGALRSSLT